MTPNNTNTQSNNVDPDFKGASKDIAKHLFYYGKGMQSKCISSSKHFLTYIGTRFGESEKQSIEYNAIIVTEMVKPKTYAIQKEFEAEDWDVQLEWKV